MSHPFQKSKQDIRSEVERHRDGVSVEERAVKSAAICESLIERFLAPQTNDSSRIVFTYVPFRSEVDIYGLLEWCWSHKRPVAVPRVNRVTREMSIHVVTGPDQLVTGAYGIREPDACVPELTDWQRLGWIIMPGVAFDRRGGRLGYGGGYYDRFVAKLEAEAARTPAAAAPLRIAPAYELQLLAEVPMEEHDFRVDYLVTELATYSLCCTTNHD